MTTPEAPAYDPEELYGIVNADPRHPYDVREVIARSSTDRASTSSSSATRTTLVTGFARLHGFLVGIIANNGVLFSESALKATHFIELCNLRGIPLDLPAEHHGLHGRPAGTSAAASRRTARRWCTPSRTRVVPKFTVIIGGSFGAGNYGMCGRAYEPRLLWMWPNARISVMGGEQAAVRAGDGQSGSARARGPRAQPRTRPRRSGSRFSRNTIARDRPTTPPRASGTTACSIRRRHATRSRSACRPPSTRRLAEPRVRHLPHVSNGADLIVSPGRRHDGHPQSARRAQRVQRDADRRAHRVGRERARPTRAVRVVVLQGAGAGVLRRRRRARGCRRWSATRATRTSTTRARGRAMFHPLDTLPVPAHRTRPRRGARRRRRTRRRLRRRRRRRGRRCSASRR